MDIDIMQAQLQKLMRYLPMIEEIAEERDFETTPAAQQGQPSQPPGPDAPNLDRATGAGVRAQPELTRPR